jgi:hypothetical protein
MIDMLLHFWGYTWTKTTYGPGNTYKNVPPYKYRDLEGNANEQPLIFTETLAKTNISLLRPVAVALAYAKNSHLNKRYFCPETFFESLALIDSICLLIINTMPENDQPRYRVYDKEGCCIFNSMDGVSRCLSEARRKNLKIRGLACRYTQFCSLYPVDEQPNFAGNGAIEQFA